MSDITQILAQIDSGDPAAAEQLLALVYDELRRLAAQKLAQERPGQTLQATALVHETFFRLFRPESQSSWESRNHFFGAGGRGHASRVGGEGAAQAPVETRRRISTRGPG